MKLICLALATLACSANLRADDPVADRSHALQLENARLAKPEEQMLLAARQGRLAAVKSALQQGVNLYCSDPFEMNVLSCAIAGDQDAVTHWLLADGKFEVTTAVKFRESTVDQSRAYFDQAGAPALAMAAMQGKTDLVADLLRRGVNPDAAPESHVPRALFSAVEKHNRGAAKLLLKAGARATWGQSEEGYGPQLLVADKDLELLDLCFEKGQLDVDFSDGDGRSLVARAAQIGWNEGTRMLLNRGASPFHRDLAGKDAFDHAIDDGMRDLLLLGSLEHDSDGSEKAKAAIALYRAIQKNDVAMALSRCGAGSLNYQDRFGRTPLIFATFLGREDAAFQILHAHPTSMSSPNRARRWAGPASVNCYRLPRPCCSKGPMPSWPLPKGQRRSRLLRSKVKSGSSGSCSKPA